MSNLIKHAQRELEIAGMFDEDSDYSGMAGKDILELIEVFASQGHSGASASIVRQLFNKLADFQPLCPLTFKDEEWGTGADQFQNNRNTAVFKKTKDSKPYYIDAYYQKTQTGSTWSGSLSIGDGRRIKHCYIKDPSKMPIICIDIIEWEVNKEDETIIEPGSGCWKHKMKDISQLKELEKYYEIEYIKDN